MATLIEEAQATRDAAVRLRIQAVGLRSATGHIVGTARGRIARAHAECLRLHSIVDAPQPSPWSELTWLREDESLERTLVPLP